MGVDIKLGKRIYKNVKCLRVPLASGKGTARFTLKSGTLIMDHAGSENVDEYAEVRTTFEEYTQEMKEESERTINALADMVDRVIEYEVGI